MLVLALQFSRGAKEARPAQRSSLELDADDPLPHNGRENEAVTRDPTPEANLRRRRIRVTAHQCTN